MISEGWFAWELADLGITLGGGAIGLVMTIKLVRDGWALPAALWATTTLWVLLSLTNFALRLAPDAELIDPYGALVEWPWLPPTAVSYAVATWVALRCADRGAHWAVLVATAFLVYGATRTLPVWIPTIPQTYVTVYFATAMIVSIVALISVAFVCAEFEREQPRVQVRLLGVLLALPVAVAAYRGIYFTAY